MVSRPMNIRIINTGGTISCCGKPLAPMSAKEFAEASKSILDPIIKEIFPNTKLCYETDLRFPGTTGTLDSTNLQPSDWCLMAKYILDNYAEYDSFVVLHGTDSMDFTGSALSFLLNVFDENGFGTAVLSKPVIITGSQVPMYYLSSNPQSSKSIKLNFNTDAYQNFCGAVACARLGIPEVGVYFDAQLYRGNRVLKINASEFGAFNSPNYPVLAKYGITLETNSKNIMPGPVSDNVSLDNPATLCNVKDQLEAIKKVIDEKFVMQFSAFPAPYNTESGNAFIGEIITACVAKNIKGLILESYGEGNFPSGNPDTPGTGGIYKALDAANQAGVIIIDSTQVIAGTVNNSAYASGAWLPKVGALSAFDMTPVAALAKTIVLLSAAEMHRWDLDTVKTLLQLNLSGEMMNACQLDSRENDELLPGQSIAALDGSASLFNDPITGPRLISSDGEVLWSPFTSSADEKPGHLEMQNDGNLVLYDDNHFPIWATNTHNPDGASSVLMIRGSYGKKTLSLSVYDYSRNRKVPTAVLYYQPPTN